MLLTEFFVYATYVGVVSLVGIITGLIFWIRRWYGSLEKVLTEEKVIKPAVLFGSYPAQHKYVVHEEDMKNHKKYGEIFGMYEGATPFIFVNDVEIVKQVFVKDFDYFHDKRIFDFGSPLINEMLDILPVDKWRLVRNLLTPTFTTGKIKTMSNLMLDGINDCVTNLNNECKPEKEIDVKELFTALTTDIFARCVFGIHLNSMLDKDNPFMKHIRKFNLDEVDIGYDLVIAFTFPKLASLTPFIPHETLEYFANILRNVMKERREKNIKKGDFIDTLNEMMVEVENNPEFKRLKINEGTVIAQALIFLFAGFDTTATTLTMLCYRMATNPEIQEKLYEEIEAFQVRNNGAEFTHANIGELKYLHGCVNETLRMCPPLIRIERVCQKDWSFKGLDVKKGMTIQVSAWAMHYNENYYPDPYEFKPERFLPENKDQYNPYAFLSFGLGNHNCIGMRFALEEVKLAMANIMKGFSLGATDQTKIKFKPGRTFLVQYQPIKIKFSKRNH